MTDELIKEFAIKAGLPMCKCGCDMPSRQVAEAVRLLIQEIKGIAK